MLLQTWAEVFTQSFQVISSGIIEYIPNLFIALVIFILGWVFGAVLGRVVSQIIKSIKVDNALREAMREAPDVIMIGEARDKETMEAALRYADTGHLCLTTLHATNANQTLDRMLNFFPSEAHNQVLMDLSLNLNCVLAQRLVKTESGSRIVAVEVLVNTPYISKLIRDGNFHEIKEIMEKGHETGMKTFDQSLFELYCKEIITAEDALRNAESQNNLRLKIKLESPQSKKSKDDVFDTDLIAF